MSIDFTYFYKERYIDIDGVNAGNSYDLFISFCDESYRVKQVFENINSLKKILFYDIESLYSSSYENFKISNKEFDDVRDFFNKFPLDNSMKICLDITGFTVPYILLFLKFFQSNKILKFDIIYSEPDYYKDRSKTKFTDDFIEVKQIEGYRGIHSTDESNDYLIIGSGYDYSSIIDVCKHKENVHKKHQLFGFPSLQPDMYQENMLKISDAKNTLNFESISDPELNLFAPANDPFVTAQEIMSFIKRNDEIKKITNIYLSPLSTKAHALGFGLYYIWNECHKEPISIIFPFCNKMYRNTSEGLSKISVYNIELPEVII